MRIAIAGTGRLAAMMLERLVDSRHEIVATVQDGRRTRGWRRTASALVARLLPGRYSVTKWAARLRVPVIYIDRMTDDELAPLKAVQPDILLVGGFSIILKPPILGLPRIGCVNCHSSLLPRHRGPNPFAATILGGDEHAGVTFHIMEPGIDTGAILEQVAFPVESEETAISLYKTSCEKAADLVVGVMDRIETDGLQGEPQDTALASYDKKPSVEDAWVDWNKSAEEIHRLVRAISPSPLPRFRFRERVVLIARTSYDDNDCGAAPGTVLRAGRPARIATGRGTLTLLLALAPTPLPWFWPSSINRPEVGENLQEPDE